MGVEWQMRAKEWEEKAQESKCASLLEAQPVQDLSRGPIHDSLTSLRVKGDSHRWCRWR